MVRTITRWTKEETALLIKLVDQYRNNFKLVASVFPSRSYNQVKGHYFNILHKQNNSQEDKINSVVQHSQVIKVGPSFDSQAQTTLKSKDSQIFTFEIFE
ncbi:SANT/Myb_domain [Hexamita inflata]|uniref:SANT/Myb domain n=1 Tax=Hexamita inflata TaxID=28002 RepID=A0AA86QFD7_9EUKA|nr:SANT/Myb domain [Hexamita inflata]